MALFPRRTEDGGSDPACGERGAKPRGKAALSHLLAGLIAEDQEQLQRLPGLPDEMRRRIVTDPHPHFLSAETAAVLMAQIDAGRSHMQELPLVAPVPMDAAVKVVHAEAARLAHGWKWSWLLSPPVDTKHYWRALLESGLPEGAVLLSRFPEFGQ